MLKICLLLLLVFEHMLATNPLYVPLYVATCVTIVIHMVMEYRGIF